MNIRLAAGILGLLFLLPACTGFGVRYSADISDENCQKGPTGAAKLIVINIKYDDKEIHRPDRACARLGDTLWFKVKAKQQKRVSVNGKDNEWIKGESSKAWFFVQVPSDALDVDEEKRVFEYGISVYGLPDLDPEVLVRRQ